MVKLHEAASPDRRLLLWYDAHGRGLPYVGGMDRVVRFFAAYGLDVLIVCAAVASAVGTVLRTDPEQPDGPRLVFEVAAVSLVVLVLLARRRFPFLAPASVWVVAPALSFLDGDLIASQPGVFLAGMYAAFLLGGLRRGQLARLGLVLVLVGSAVVVYHNPTHTPADLIGTPVLFAVAWLAGFGMRERNQQAEAAEERARRAERDRESAARLAVAEERARMARELHDVVAHAVSVMVLQVGAVRHRIPAGAEEGEALRNVEQAGRTALAEMRRLLGALRDGDDLVELAPHPGLDDLASLADDVRAAGLDVRLHVHGAPVALPRSLDLSAYRIVQEGLTNALKHSGARRADVTVDYATGELLLEVRDDGPGGFAQTDGFGHGLIGIGERVKIYGGDMSAFVATSGGFVLRAALPLESDPA
jgi:signal transduction histidine kinase